MRDIGKRTLRISIGLGAIVGLVGCGEEASTFQSTGAHEDYAVTATNGLASINGLSSTNGLSANGLSANGLSANGLSANGLSANGLSANGLSLAGALTSANGLSSSAGMMTSADGRRTVSYITKCALAAGDALVKQDQYGNNYTFPGSLGLAPGWKAGVCDQTCQELMSACLMAHVNSYGVHYPLWLDSTGPGIGWGMPASNFKREGTFFGNILATGGMNHGNLSAPLGYFCEGPGVTGGSLVAGRMGTSNAQSAAPFYNAYLGSSCDGSYKCNAHKPDGVNIDGYNTCADNGGNTFNNTVTVFRDPTVLPVFDANYVYSIRGETGSSGTAMTVQYGNYSNGNPLIQWRFMASNKLRIVDSGAGNGSFQISSWENQGICLDNPGSQTANGTQVQLYNCSSNNPWQQWMISVDTATSAAVLKNVGSGKCLDDTGWIGTGSVPVIWDCTGTVNQKWRVTVGYWNPGSDGSAGFINGHPNDAYVLLAGNGAGNLALDTWGNYFNGGKPSLNSGIDTNKDDKFVILPGTSANTWTIHTQWNTGMCVDNPGSQSANGTPIQIWSCNGGSNQNWILSNRSNGGLEIKNQQSGKCLFNNNAWAEGDGAGIVIQDCDSNNYGEVWLLTTN